MCRSINAVGVCAAICIALFIIGIAGTIFALRPQAERIVEILQDGTVIYRFDLETIQETMTVEIADGDFTNIAEVRRDGVRMLSANCPDQTCVQMGTLRYRALPIVCLPHHLTIRFAETGNASSGEIDAITE